MSILSEKFGLVIGAIVVVVLLFALELLFMAAGWYLVLDVLGVPIEGWSAWNWLWIAVGSRMITRGIYTLKTSIYVLIVQ